MAERPSLVRYLICAAAVVIVVAGMRVASSLVVPFLLAVFISVILTPPMQWLKRKGLPIVVALLIVVVSVVLLGAGVVVLVGKSVNDFSKNVPTYRKILEQQTTEFCRWLDEHGVKTPEEEVIPSFDAKGAMQLVTLLLREVSGVFSNALVILVMVIFMLLEAARFPAKMSASLGPSHPALAHTDEIVKDIRRYMAIKTTTSLLTGTLVTVLLLVLGVNDALLWGLLAFLFNYVPNIGSIIAAIPPVIVALAQLGLGTAVATAAGYVSINCVISYLIEPRYMGQGLGLSTLVVFLSLVFWGWTLGPVGMLLSAPLTMIVKIILENFDETRWIAVLMGSKAPKGVGQSA